MRERIIKDKITSGYVWMLLGILAIPFLVYLIMLQYTTNYAVNQEIESTVLRAQQTRELVDKNLLYLRKIAIKVANNKKLCALQGYDVNTNGDIYETTVLANQLSMELDSHDFCEDYYVFAKKANIVFYRGSRYKSEDFFKMYIKNGNYEDWKKNLSKKYYDCCYIEKDVFEKTNNSNNFEYRQSYPMGGTAKGTICFVIDKDKLILDNMKKQYKSDKVEIYIVNKDNEIIYNANGKEEIKDKLLMLNDGYSHIDGNAVVQSTGTVGELRYIYVDRGSSSYQNASKISLFSLWFALIIFIGGGIYIYLAIKRVAKRNQRIYKLLNNNNQEKNVMNWEILLNGLEELNKKGHMVQRLTLIKDEMTRNKFLIDVLLGHSEYIDKTCEQLHEMGVDFDSEYYILMLGSFEIKNDEKPDMLKFVIQNILTDLLSSEIKWNFIDYNWNQVIILFKCNEANGFEEKVSMISQQLFELTLSILNVHVEFEVSELSTNIEEIRKAAYRLLNRYEYKCCLKADEVENSTASNNDNEYHYSQKQESELISLVLNGKTEETEELINSIYMAQKGSEDVMIRVLTYSLLASLFKCATLIGVSDLVKNAENTVVLYSKNTEEMKNALIRLFKNVTESINSDKKKVDEYETLGNKLFGYVNMNYYDCNLSLKTIAVKFDITPSYVSKMFKERVGENFSNYLTEKRIEKSKELLKNTDLSVSEIAEKVGYIDSSIFIRNFKKFTKMTPGAYRSQNN